MSAFSIVELVYAAENTSNPFTGRDLERLLTNCEAGIGSVGEVPPGD